MEILDPQSLKTFLETDGWGPPRKQVPPHKAVAFVTENTHTQATPSCGAHEPSSSRSRSVLQANPAPELRAHSRRRDQRRRGLAQAAVQERLQAVGHRVQGVEDVVKPTERRAKERKLARWLVGWPAGWLAGWLVEFSFVLWFHL